MTTEYITSDYDRQLAGRTLHAKATHLAMDLYGTAFGIGYEAREDSFMVVSQNTRDNYVLDAYEALCNLPHLMNLAEREVMLGPGLNL